MASAPNSLQLALRRDNPGPPPVWLLQQSASFHTHFRSLRDQYSYADLCKNPELSCEASIGPLRDFDFDAALLFSSPFLLLETLGLDLRVEPAPHLAQPVQSLEDLNQLLYNSEQLSELFFQAEALKKIKNALSPEKGLIGLVPAPLTLFCFVIEGKEQRTLGPSLEGIEDGRFSRFVERALPLLLKSMELQALSQTDTLVLWDPAVGQVDASVYAKRVLPLLQKILKEFTQKYPKLPITYMAQTSGPEHWEHFDDLPISCLGIGHQHDLVETLKRYGDRYSIYGNIHPEWLLMDAPQLTDRLTKLWEEIRSLPPEYRQGWICGLGSELLPATSEKHMSHFMQTLRSVFLTS